jgi:hypothetical protein
MLVGPDAGALDRVELPVEPAGGIGLRFKRIQHMLADAGFLPALAAAGHRSPGAIVLRQIMPGGTGAQNPQQTIEDAAMVDGWASGLGFLRRE